MEGGKYHVETTWIQGGAMGIKGNKILVMPSTPSEKWIDLLRENAKLHGCSQVSITRKNVGDIDVMQWVYPPNVSGANVIWTGETDGIR